MKAEPFLNPDVKNSDYSLEDLEENQVVIPEISTTSQINIDLDTVKFNSFKE